MDGFPALRHDEPPEEQFVALYQEMSVLRTERNVYAQGMDEIRKVVYGDPIPQAIAQLTPSDLVRLLVDDVIDVYRQCGRLSFKGIRPAAR